MVVGDRRGKVIAARPCAMRIAVALCLGTIFHAAWVVLFILGASLGASGIARGLLWVVAPLMTAAGYATGLTIPVRSASALEPHFWRVFAAELVGCAIGAVVGSAFGPMFAGLGTLGGGGLFALALAVRDRLGPEGRHWNGNHGRNAHQAPRGGPARPTAD